MTEREKKEEGERNLMEYSENGTKRLKGFSLSATHGQQITDLFGYIESTLKRGDECRRNWHLSWMLR